jgi:hypothetical protein
MTTKWVYEKPVPEHCDLMTVAEYLTAVDCRGFVDTDGMGSPVKDGMIGRWAHRQPGDWDYISPSGGRDAIPLEATHIAWFNK